MGDKHPLTPKQTFSTHTQGDPKGPKEKTKKNATFILKNSQFSIKNNKNFIQKGHNFQRKTPAQKTSKKTSYYTYF